MGRMFLLAAVCIGVLHSTVSQACTSAIIPGWATPDGRPLLWKHRDTGTLENSIGHFKGEIYSFVGLVNSDSPGGEVWIGSNTAGFSIMNTASYCLKDDDVPAACMDREGVLMYRALEICATLKDFEHFLDTLSRPMGVEANFGCIDACGGAAYYEAGNYGYVKRDVAAMETGYCVVTNFSLSGRKEDWKGYERYLTADNIFGRMKGESRSFRRMSPHIIMDSLSRSYGHQVLGIDLVRDSAAFLSSSRGVAVDQDFIPRRSTSASVVVQGVRQGEDACRTVLWAALGYPSCAVMLPVPVSGEDHVPSCMKGEHSALCSLSLGIKEKWIFSLGSASNLGCYMDMRPVLAGSGGMPSLMSCSSYAEKVVGDAFLKLQSGLYEGRIAYRKYLKEYDRLAESLMDIVLRSYGGYIENARKSRSSLMSQSNFADLHKNP